MSEDKAEPPDHLDPDKVFEPDTAFSFTYLQNLGDGSPNPEKNRLKEVLRTLDKSNIRLGECVQPKVNDQAELREGYTSYCARLKVAPKDEGGKARDVPDAVVRIDPLGYEDIVGSLSIGSAWIMDFPDPGSETSGYRVRIVPYVPDDEEKVGREDVKRFIGVSNKLKVEKKPGADGKMRSECSIATAADLTNPDCVKLSEYLTDIQPDQFVFVRGAEGDLIRYPDDAGFPYAGSPVTILRDINSLCANKGGEAVARGRLNEYMETEELEAKDIPSAPDSCVLACLGARDFLDKKLRENLSSAGIKPNVPIPETTAPSTITVTGVVPVQSEKKPKGQPL